MELKHFLEKEALRQINFARTVEISKNYLSEIVNKKRRPSANLALKISKATGGQVTVIELLFPDNGAPGKTTNDVVSQ